MKLELELPTREQYIIALSLSVGIVTGLWFGILMMSSRALDVPMCFLDDGAMSALYYLMTNTHPFVSAALSLVTAYLVRNHAWDDRMDDVDELMPDRSSGDGGGCDSTHGLDGSSTNEFGLYPLGGGEFAWSARTLPRSACAADGRWLLKTPRRKDASAGVAFATFK